MSAKSTKQGISRAELSRLENVERSTVHQWEKQGWLVLWPDRSVDPDATMIRVKACRQGSGGDHRSAKKTTRAPATKTAEVNMHKPTDRPPAIPSDDDIDIEECRRRRAYWDAEQSRMTALQTSGELTSVAKVEATAFKAARLCRDRIQAVPARIAPRIASLGGDIVAVETLLASALREALTAIADEFAAIAGTRRS